MVARTQADREAIIGSYQYLCRRGARKFWRAGLDRSDLEQVAAIGLIKAFDRYDSSSRTPFEAYAWLLIVGELMHHVRDHEHPVRMPRRLQRLEKDCARAEERLTGVFGREPLLTEIASDVGIPTDTIARVRNARESAKGSARIDDPNEGERLRNALPHPIETVSLEDRILLRTALATLPEAANAVILGIYALGMTRAQLAIRLGETPRGISRLHNFALRRMADVFAGTSSSHSHFRRTT